MRAGRVTASTSSGRGHDPRRPRPAHGRSAGARGRSTVRRSNRGRVVLSVRGVSAAERSRPAGAPRRRRWTSTPGEIVGIAAVAGNGQAELAEADHRACGRARGRITIDGRRRRQPTGERRDPRRASGTCPRTAPGSGARPNLSIVDNLIMKHYRHEPVAHGLAHGRRRRPGDGDVDSRRPTRCPRRRSTRPSGSSRAATCSGSSSPARSTRRRRSWSRSSRPAASTSAPSRASTRRCWSSARGGTAILLISEELEELLALARPDRGHVRGPDRGVGRPRRPPTSTRSACT